MTQSEAGAKPNEEQDPEWLITPEMRARIGVESAPVTYEVEKGPIRMYARAVGYNDLQFWDEDYAKSLGYKSLVAPPGFFGFKVTTNPNEYTGAGEGGDAPETARSARGSVREDKSGNVMSGLNAGQRYVLTPNVMISAGDILTAVGRMVSIRQTATSRGPTIITENETTLTNQDGVVVARRYGTQISSLVKRGGEESK